MTTPLTGDIKDRTEVKKEGVTLHNFPQALNTHLSAKGNIVNDASQSGKRLGAQVMGVTKDANGAVTAATLFVAAGEASDAKWIAIKAIVGSSASDITPA